MMNKLVLLALAGVVGMSAVARAQAPKPSQAPTPTGTQWRQAEPGYQYSFPRDHAAHPDNKIEWWYYTGNVKAADGRRFGFQITFFRVGIEHTPANPSKWAVRDLYMTHLAVSDAKGQRYRFAEKLTRGGPGLAGAETERYRVWNENWSAELVNGQHKIVAMDAKAGVDLLLDEGKPPVIHGMNGISQKGSQAGNASHYYSLTRMPTRGTIMVDGERFTVTGETWMDHETGTSFLEPDQRGWDWLSIQLSDNRELMLYQLRRADGSRDPRSSGTLVDARGKAVHLADADFTLTPGRSTFKSSNGAVYPTEWTVRIPSQQLELTITTPIADQELSLVGSTGVAYWEGMIDVAGHQAIGPSGNQANGPSGRQANGPTGQQANRLTGVGYLEMTGYHGSLGRVLSGQ